MMNNLIFPWQSQIWYSLWQRKQSHCLPHALLFSGIEGVGKKRFAIGLASALLCAAPDKEGCICQKCQSCLLMKAETHPDLMLIGPEEAGQIIKVNQVRKIVDFVNKTALIGGYRIIIIDPATAMNAYAANALLKTLEEPTESTLFILISGHVSLLPTIKSRCQLTIFPKPNQNQALSWLREVVPDCSDPDLRSALKLAEGAPLYAKKIVENNILGLRQSLYQGLIDLSAQRNDPVLFAAQWQDKSSETMFRLLLSWLRDMLRTQLSCGEAEIINHDYQVVFQQCMRKILPENMMRYIEHIQGLYRKVIHSPNLNYQLILEDIFIRWVKLCI